MTQTQELDARRLAFELHARIRQLEAERDRRPIPPLSDFTEQAMDAKWDALVENARRSGPYPYWTGVTPSTTTAPPAEPDPAGPTA